MGRYFHDDIVTNESEFYEFLRKKRDVKRIIQYATPKTHIPRLNERLSLRTASHIWTYGDRYFKLAHKYYKNTSYWWVIAWYNGRPTEADIQAGDAIDIPLNLEDALRAIGSA